MEIKVTVSLSDEDRKVLTGVMNALNNVKVTVEDEKPTPKKGRGKKAKVEEPEEIEETIEDEDTDVEDLSDDEEVEETDDAEEIDEDIEEDTDVEAEDDEPAKVDAKQLANLKKALNTYSGKNGKDKAVKILHKYAKVSQDVKADDYGKLMKALKV